MALIEGTCASLDYMYPWPKEKLVYFTSLEEERDPDTYLKKLHRNFAPNE